MRPYRRTPRVQSGGRSATVSVQLRVEFSASSPLGNVEIGVFLRPVPPRVAAPSEASLGSLLDQRPRRR